MRDRLIELLYCAGREYDDYVDDCHEVGLSPMEDFDEMAADYLLEHGVIVPPCKVKPGDDIYFLLDDDVLPSGWYISKERVTEVGTRGFWTSDKLNEDNVAQLILWSEVPGYVFFTHEEAEKALAQREGKG